jgi:hypothetical protein
VFCVIREMSPISDPLQAVDREVAMQSTAAILKNVEAGSSQIVAMRRGQRIADWILERLMRKTTI